MCAEQGQLTLSYFTGLIFHINPVKLYISATKYPSEAVLYLKRTAEYLLSPHIKTIAVAFLQAE